MICAKPALDHYLLIALNAARQQRPSHPVILYSAYHALASQAWSLMNLEIVFKAVETDSNFWILLNVMMEI